MATKTQKQTFNKSEKIVKAYMDFVLTEEKEPASVYAFAKDLKISEAEFYKYFTHFKDIDQTIWIDAFDNCIKSLKTTKEYKTYTSREKMLGFFYTLIEAVNQNRSYFIYSMRTRKLQMKQNQELKNFVSILAKEIIQEGLDTNELETRQFLSERYHEAVWINVFFVLNFWAGDNSKGFEKTDAAIEKSVNLMMELMGKSALDGFLDFGKFLVQNGMKTGIKF